MSSARWSRCCAVLLARTSAGSPISNPRFGRCADQPDLQLPARVARRAADPQPRRPDHRPADPANDRRVSDRARSPRWGRHKPFFLIGAIGCSVGLFLFPFVAAIWMAVPLLWLLDAS